MKSLSKTCLGGLSAASAIILAFTIATNAQVQTSTNTTAGTSTQEVKVDRAVVENVSGNDVWVKMEDGQIRHIRHVAESAKISVDGKQVSVHELHPGMKLERTITTTTTPRTVTTVETVTGKVWHVSPPKSVVLSMENGENQQFTVPDGQIFKINGEEKDIWHLKKGMVVTATKTTEAPESVVEHQRQLTGTMPAPPLPVPSDMPVLIARVEVSHGPSTATLPAELPKTASPLPLIGLLGLLLSGASFCMRLSRR